MGTKVKITFKIKPRPKGLIGVVTDSHHIRVDGVDIGTISPLGRGWANDPVRGYYFYAGYNGKRINTCDEPVATVEEAKAGAKAWILSLTGN